MAKGWELKGSANGVTSLRKTAGVRLVVLKAVQDIARDAAAGTDATAGPMVAFRWDLPAGFRWDMQKGEGRAGWIGSVVASHPTKAGRQQARQRLRSALVSKKVG